MASGISHTQQQQQQHQQIPNPSINFKDAFWVKYHFLCCNEKFINLI